MKPQFLLEDVRVISTGLMMGTAMIVQTIVIVIMMVEIAVDLMSIPIIAPNAYALKMMELLVEGVIKD